MSYDRESYLAGLAVGRTLWRPHTVSPGHEVGVYPCYLAGDPYTVDWEYADFDFVQLVLNPGASNPNPLYWMLWERLDPISEDQRFFVVLFSPDITWDEATVASLGIVGVDSDGGVIGVSGMGYRFTTYPDATLCRNRTASSSFSQYGNLLPQLFASTVYLKATASNFEHFMTTARMVTTPGQMYIVGEML